MANVKTEITSAHAEFSEPDADVTLISEDGIAFGTHSFTLRKSSGFFRHTLTLPQPQSPSAPTPVTSTLTIQLEEKANVLEALLRIIMGKAHSPLHTFEFIESIIHAAEKYEMPGPMSAVQHAIVNIRLVKQDPLRVYAIASQYGWIVEASIASSETLSYDLAALSPKAASSFRGMGWVHLMKLMQLHAKRREGMRQYMLDFELPPNEMDESDDAIAHTTIMTPTTKRGIQDN
jgi:hypothetical protein